MQPKSIQQKYRNDIKKCLVVIVSTKTRSEKLQNAAVLPNDLDSD